MTAGPLAEGHEQAVAEFRAKHGFAANDESASVWMATLGRFEMPLPNFRWRREILAQHDSNHLRAGLDISARGELLVAAWEFGSQCYADWRAKGLCLMLMGLGMVRYPKATLAAYRKGKAERTSQEYL